MYQNLLPGGLAPFPPLYPQPHQQKNFLFLYIYREIQPSLFSIFSFHTFPGA